MAKTPVTNFINSLVALIHIVWFVLIYSGNFWVNLTGANVYPDLYHSLLMKYVSIIFFFNFLLNISSYWFNDIRTRAALAVVQACFHYSISMIAYSERELIGTDTLPFVTSHIVIGTLCLYLYIQALAEHGQDMRLSKTNHVN